MIKKYLEAGEALEMGPLELQDYYDISSPGLPEKAGFSYEELENASELFEEVSTARYR